MSIYPAWFHAARAIVKPFWKKLSVKGEENLQEPCVLVTRHLNNYGPFAVYLFAPFEFHMWSFYVFFDPDDYYKHCSEFTFSKRAGMPKWLACALAGLLSHPAAWFYRSLRMIPVYRGTREIFKTLDLSLEVLEKGENILIMTDVNYAGEGSEMGEMYTGFLHLGKQYYQRTGKNLRFAAMSINRENRYLRVSAPIEFDGAAPYRQERDRVGALLKQELKDNY